LGEEREGKGKGREGEREESKFLLSLSPSFFGESRRLPKLFLFSLLKEHV